MDNFRPLVATVQALVTARTWTDCWRIVEQHPELLGKEADSVLALLAATLDDPSTQALVAQHRALLARCQEIGVACAFAEKMGPEGASDLPEELAHDVCSARAAEEEYRRSADPAALDNAVEAWGRVLRHPAFAAVAVPQRCAVLNDAGISALDRYAARGQLLDLDHAVAYCEQAVALTAPDAPQQPVGLSNLGNALRARYERTGDLGDLTGAIASYEQAVALIPRGARERPGYLSNLGVGLSARYELSGDHGDLAAAVAAFEEAVALTRAEDPHRSVLLSNLGNALHARYARRGDLGDLGAAITAQEEAVELTAEDSPDRPRHLSNLGGGLRARYECTGDLGDLDAAIGAGEEALALTVADAPDRRVRLSNLGVGLHDRYARTGDLGDLGAAIAVFEEALALTLADTPDRPSHLTNLGCALHTRYARRGDLGDLGAAITAQEEAVELTAEDSPDRPRILTNLGTGLHDRYARTGDLGDLGAAIAVFEEALALAAVDAPRRPGYLSNLGNALRARYERTRDLGDLGAAIAAHEEAVAHAAADAPDRPRILTNLGAGLHRRYERTGARGDLAAGAAVYEEAVTSGLTVAPDAALGASRNWGTWAAERAAWAEAARAYRMGLEALDALVRQQLLRPDKEAWLREAQGLPGRAAYALARAGELRAAVVALERGRGTLLAEALARDRADLEAVAATRPDLYVAYRDAAARLAAGEASSLRPAPAAPAGDLRAARMALDAAVEAIRTVPGYAAFLRPLQYEEGQAVLAAPGGPAAIVYLATTPQGSIALAVDDAGEDAVPVVVWLDEFTEAALDALLHPPDDGDTGSSGGLLAGQLGDRGALEAALAQALPALGAKVMGPLAARLRARGFQGKTVALIPAGRLGLLPLHAACYPVEGARTHFLDEFPVAYAPNARALAAAYRTRAACDGARRLAGVGNPLPHPRPLPAAAAELEEVATLFVTQFPDTTHGALYAEKATREAFVPLLAEATDVYAACHGRFALGDPLASCLQLGGTDVVTLRDVLYGDAQLGRARLAVLSACRTALSDIRHLPDEYIGLPAGFLQAGVAGVVGTLWAVDDLATALLMVKFYEYHLGKNGEAGSSAEALDPPPALARAQRWLREVTNGELTKYFATHHELNAARALLLQATVSAGLAWFGLADPAARPFANRPVCWAPFVFVGA